jgi:hypothetical protein
MYGAVLGKTAGFVLLTWPIGYQDGLAVSDQDLGVNLDRDRA